MRITEFITEAANPAQQAAIAIAKKEEQGVAEGYGDGREYGGAYVNGRSDDARMTEKLTRQAKAAAAKAGKTFSTSAEYRLWHMKQKSKKQGVAEDWQKVNHHDKTDGMSRKAVKAYRRENPGSKLKTAVTTKPSKLKPGSKAAKRRKSFCARMGGNKGPMKKPNGKPTPKALALRRWNCESIEELQELVMLAEQFVNKKKNESI